jgi:hypothetical protein
MLLLAGWLAIGGAIAGSNPNYQWTAQPRSTPFGGDFLQEWTGANILHSPSAASLYDLETFGMWQHDLRNLGFEWNPDAYYPPVYPPVYYWLLAPLGELSYRTATYVWLGLLLLAFLLAVALCELTIAWRNTEQDLVPAEPPLFRGARERCAPWLSAAFWLAMLILPAVLSGWTFGQKGALWLLILTVGWALWQHDRKFLAGVVLALLTIKPTLMICVPIFMLWKRQGWFLLGLTLGSLALWGSAALWLPRTLWQDYLLFASQAASYQANSGYQLAWSCSMVTLFEVSQVAEYPGMKAILWLTLAGFVLGSLREIRLEQVNQPETLFRLLLATCLLSPHWYYYDLVWLVLPLRLMFHETPRRVIVYVAALWSGMLAAQWMADHANFPILALVTFGVLMHSRLRSGQAQANRRKADAAQAEADPLGLQSLPLGTLQ